MTDWNAVAARVTAYAAATGHWTAFEDIPVGWNPGDAPPPSAPPTAQDWGIIAARVSAYHEATGHWAAYEDIPTDWQPGDNAPPPVDNPPQPVDNPAGGWFEGFDHGVGVLSHTWGHVWAHDGVVEVASWAGEGWQPAGIMQAPTGAAAGQGYGTYSVSAAFNANAAPGGFICLWPADDVWPQFELDLVEKDNNGRGYSTIHYEEGGADRATSHYLPAELDLSQFHTYALTWAPGLLTLAVDGAVMWSDDQHVPLDHAHGGTNAAFGVGQLPAWAAAYQHGDQVITVDWASYSPFG